MMMTEKTSFDCTVSQVRVVVWRQYIGEMSGIGDDAPVPQYDYECSREAACAAAGLAPKCPLGALR